MTGYNHYRDCLCGWCVKYGRGAGLPTFDHDATHARTILDGYRYREGSFASCFVSPNADCPVCGARVFFYANARGSRVFFDDLGRPWPKHPCTDSRKVVGVRPQKVDPPELKRRSRGEIDEIGEQLLISRQDARGDRSAKYGPTPESVFIVEDCARRGFENLIVAQELVGWTGERLGIRFTAQNYEVAVGDLISFDGGRIAVFVEGADMSKTYAATYCPASDIEKLILSIRNAG